MDDDRPKRALRRLLLHQNMLAGPRLLLDDVEPRFRHATQPLYDQSLPSDDLFMIHEPLWSRTFGFREGQHAHFPSTSESSINGYTSYDPSALRGHGACAHARLLAMSSVSSVVYQHDSVGIADCELLVQAISEHQARACLKQRELVLNINTRFELCASA